MKINIYRTSKNKRELFLESKPLENVSDAYEEIVINPNEKYQTLLGFGGALTSASQEVLSKMSKDMQEEVLNAVFSSNGLNYSLIRLSINSCDFSSEIYDYLGGNKDLKAFSLSKEDRTISYIKKIEEIHKGPINILASPWSAPAYMKSNHNMLEGGKLLKEYYQDWADYFSLYILGMKEKGIDINYVTIQNEPQAKQIWESMEYTKEEESIFCHRYLTPTLKRNNIDTKIIVWDHNKDHVFEWADEIFKEENTYVDGVGYHWYCSDEFGNLDKIHKKHPNKHIFFTEGCVELVNKCLHGELFDFKNGEIYGRNYILGLLHHTEAYFDWNVLLNEIGGPNHVGNYCEAPIMYDAKGDKLIYNTSYYFIKHFSYFLDKGDYRIGVNQLENLNVVAFKKRFENKYILIIQNEKNIDETKKVKIFNNSFTIDVPSHSIQTIILEDK